MGSGAAREQRGDSVGERLAHPAHLIPLADLPARWLHHRVRVVAAVPAGVAAPALAADPGMPGRVRGAWGRRLMETASGEALAGQPCPWVPPCAYDALFRERRLLPGLEMPKPFVFAVDAPGPRLLAVTMTLFGFSGHWLDAGTEALVAGLRGGLGLEPLDRTVERIGGIPLPPVPPRAGLEFHTPLSLRREGRMAPVGPTLLSSLGNRVSALSRWQDARSDADWLGLKQHAATLDFDAGGMAPVRWQRASARQGGRTVPMEGLAGTLWIAGDLAPVWPLLVLGTTTHAGSHAALGLGRYRLTGGNPDG